MSGLGQASWQARWLEWLLRVRRRHISALGDIGALRADVEAIDGKFRVDPSARRTPVYANDVPCEWLDVPESNPGRIVLYLHGGGFTLRTPNLHARFLARVCRTLGARALTVDYRLAPEHPCPAGIDDCHHVYRWLLGQGAAPGDIAVAGDSAGGNLVLVTLQRVKTAREPMPACAVAISPVVDLTLGSNSFVDNERSDAIFTPSTALALRRLYVAPQLSATPDVSPLFGDLAGLPPLLLQAGARELLRDDSTRFTTAARAAGVDVECEIWPGMQHVFPLLQFLPESGRAIDSIARFIRARTGWDAAVEQAPVAKLAVA